MLSCVIDINECDNANGGCEHDCTNTIGSSSCSCHEGHLLDLNGLNCSGEQNHGSTNFCNDDKLQLTPLISIFVVMQILMSVRALI